MCLTILVGDLGAAHAGLDVQRLVMVLSPRLEISERIIAARRMLAKAGRSQPVIPWEAICICGLMLDLTLPIASFPAPRRDRAKTVRAWLKIPVKPVNRELALADTGGFPVIRTDLRAFTGRP